MLVLSRKQGESIVFNEEIVVTVLLFTTKYAELLLSKTGGEQLRSVTISKGSTLEIIPRVRVTLVESRVDKIRLGIECPPDMSIHRKEMADAVFGLNSFPPLQSPPIPRSTPPMWQLSPYLLWIGHAGHVRDMTAVLDAGIMALVDLALNEPVPQIPRDVIYCRFPLIDGVGNSASLLRAAVHATADMIQMSVPTLVFCSAGSSRSPAIAAAAISILSRRSPADCLQEVARSIPHDVSPGLWADVVAALE